MKIKFLFLSLSLMLMYGCLTLPEAIKDETDLPQDHTAYIAQPPVRENALLSSDDQEKENVGYNAIYFSVWHIAEPVHARPERIAWIFTKFALNPGYGENKRKRSPAWMKKLQQNAGMNTYPNAMYRAITTRPTNLRMLPTNSPHFYKPVGDIAGWPFDNLQISSVAANTPALVCHLSADKSWAIVETNFAFGWVPVEDVARVDEAFMKTWESGHYAVITKDKFAIADTDGNSVLRTSVGQIFPLVHETADHLEILIAVADENSNAVIKRSTVSRALITPKPLRLTYENAVKIANELIDEPYGWGGLYGNRDCSAMTRDFFAPFGIWLPRHSADQAKTVGTYIDIKDLDADQKEKVILEQGIPYRTLLWRKGHVMLYIGQQNGRALIFHNVWGLKTFDLAGREGRKIIGKAVITTLCPGAELSCFVPQESLLINTISAITIIGPAKQNHQSLLNKLFFQNNAESSAVNQKQAYLYH